MANQMVNERVLTIIVAVIAGIVIFGFTNGFGRMSGMMGYFYPFYGLWWIFHFLFTGLVLILVVLAIIWLIKNIQK